MPDERLQNMKLFEAETVLSRNVYAATRLIEELEYTKSSRGLKKNYRKRAPPPPSHCRIRGKAAAGTVGRLMIIKKPAPVCRPGGPVQLTSMEVSNE